MATTPRSPALLLIAAMALLAAHCAGAGTALTPDHTARILAGIDAVPVARIDAAHDALRSYATSVTSRWHLYERTIGGPMRAWARSEIPPAPDATIFYPFSGPDLPTIHNLYPQAKRYVLVALQPGEAPLALETATPEQVSVLLSRLARSWEQFAHLGFFRTPDLDAKARQEGLRPGITGILMAFAARLGMRIVSVEPVRVNADGSDLEPHPGARDDPQTWRSVRLQLALGDRALLLDYVRADLSDSGLERAPAVRAWIERMAAHPTLIKAASHLLQRPSFSVVRDALLAHAPSIVQEETGIDYAELARVFDVALYGRFTGPHRLFSPQAQRSLVVAYESRKDIRPLPFRVSYQREATSNLQVAVRPGAGAVSETRAQALAATIDAQIAQHARRPRRVFLTRTVADAQHAAYVERVRKQASAALGPRDGPRQRPALVSLTLVPDGTLRRVDVERSSGDAGFDRRVRELAQAGVPFPAWPESLRRLADEVVVTLHLPE